VIDDEDLHIGFGGLQFQAELILNGSEDADIFRLRILSILNSGVASNLIS
jgi:hypothetical protein